MTKARRGVYFRRAFVIGAFIKDDQERFEASSYIFSIESAYFFKITERRSLSVSVSSDPIVKGSDNKVKRLIFS